MSAIRGNPESRFVVRGRTLTRLGSGISAMPGRAASPWPVCKPWLRACWRRRRRYTTMATITSNITAIAVHPTASPTTVRFTPPAGGGRVVPVVVSFPAGEVRTDSVAVAMRNSEESDSFQRICRGYATTCQVQPPDVENDSGSTVIWLWMPEIIQSCDGPDR